MKRSGGRADTPSWSTGIFCNWTTPLLVVAIAVFAAPGRAAEIKQSQADVTRSYDDTIFLQKGTSSDSTAASSASSSSSSSVAGKTQRQGRDVTNFTSGSATSGTILVPQHQTITLPCATTDDLVISNSVWLKDGQIVDVYDRGGSSSMSSGGGHRFIRNRDGGVFIDGVRMEDNGEWKCEAEDEAGFLVVGYTIQLVVLDRPKPPYLLIDGRRLDPGNMFIPVKENGELSISCVAEGGNPKPTLLWNLALSPNIDPTSQEHANVNLDLQQSKEDFDEQPAASSRKNVPQYQPGSGARSDTGLNRVLRAHHNATITCILQHPALSHPLNASLLLDVQYAPSFGISRIPGFGFPLREGIAVSLKCDVDSNPSSVPVWQKDDGATPVPQSGDGFLNFSAIKREDSGWYKCTSRHMLGLFSSIGYFLNVRYDPPEVTQEPDDSEASAHHVEVAVGGSVHLQCPTGTVGCWGKSDLSGGRIRGVGPGGVIASQGLALRDLLYRDAGSYRCVGRPPDAAENTDRIQTLRYIQLSVKGPPLVRTNLNYLNATVGDPAHVTMEFCANPGPTRTLWVHGDNVYYPGRKYEYVTAHNITNRTSAHCQEAALTFHNIVPSHYKSSSALSTTTTVLQEQLIFLVKSPNGLAEASVAINLNPSADWRPNDANCGDRRRGYWFLNVLVSLIGVMRLVLV